MKNRSDSNFFQTKQRSVGRNEIMWYLNSFRNLCWEMFHPYAKFPITWIPIEWTEFCSEYFTEQQYLTLILLDLWFHPNENANYVEVSCLSCAYVSIPIHQSYPLHKHE